MMRRAAKDNKRSMLIFEKLLLQNELNLGHTGKAVQRSLLSL
jgi:hypothetical protein